MIMSRPFSAWSRRALVRSSIVLMLGVSSMYMGASARRSSPAPGA
jgi:hypothetical protein